MSFLNSNKRLIILILSIVLCLYIFFPIFTIRINNNVTKDVSVANVGGIIREFKTAKNVEEFNISQINKNKPIDNFEKATLVLNDVSTNISWIRFLAVLVLLVLVLGGMIIYVKPLSKIGTTILFLPPLILISLGILVSNTFLLINQNKLIISEYFGLKGFKGLYVNETSFYYGIIIATILFALCNLILRNPKKSKNESEKLAKTILAICALIAVLSVASITIFLMIKGVPTINKIGLSNFIFSGDWKPVDAIPKFGISNLIFTSFAGTFGAILIGVPVGLLTAIFISQIISKKVAGILSALINLLAGIPSVIYGAVGLIVLVPFVQRFFNIPTGATLFSAILVLAVMVLPTIVSVSVASLNAVPITYMEASLALGLTKEASVFKVLIPAARSGIMTGVLLGLGRAIGEAMAIILVAGNAPVFPKLFAPVRFLTTGIVAEMGYATGLHRDALFAIGLVLFFFILIINSFFKYLIKKAGNKYE